jgi:hypothetical protein
MRPFRFRLAEYSSFVAVASAMFSGAYEFGPVDHFLVGQFTRAMVRKTCLVTRPRGDGGAVRTLHIGKHNPQHGRTKLFLSQILKH